MPDKRRAPSGYDAPLSSYLAQLDTHGITHGVLVQPSFLGTDNSYLLQALAQQRQRLRGIVVVPDDTPEDTLYAMDAQGVVGIRLNLIGLPTPPVHSANWQRLLATIKRLDWQVEIHREAHLLESIVEPLLSAGVKVVIDHFGRPDPTKGLDDPGFAYLLSLGKTRRVWVKLSAAYRNGSQGLGETIARQATPYLWQEFGLDRLLWGSDWPHTLFESSQTYSQAVEQLQSYLPVPSDRAQVLWNTPRELFRF